MTPAAPPNPPRPARGPAPDPARDPARDPVQALRAALAARRDDLVALTQALIRIPTINPPGAQYHDICLLLRERLAGQGFDCQLLRAHGAPGDCDLYPRWNLVARRAGRGPGDCVHFNSHIDVVEPGQGWQHDPFGAEIDQGRIYGRGACDMKGGLAASVIAVEAFLEICPDYHGAIEISATADEESGGYGGVAWLAERGFFDPARVQHVIIPEPLHKDRICLGHRGVWWAEIETKGRIAHGSMPFLGDCALRHMAALIAAMEDQLFPALAAKRTAMPVVPEGARASTLNLNSLHGGQAEPDRSTGALPSPCVPDSARLVIDRRFLIEEPIETVIAEVQALIDGLSAQRPGFAADMRELFRVLPSQTESDAPVVRALSQAIAETFGRPAEHVVSPGTYDQKHIDRIGKLRNCVAYGPGLLELAHQPDEYVGIDDMLDSAEVMGRSLIALLAPKAAAGPEDAEGKAAGMGD